MLLLRIVCKLLLPLTSAAAAVACTMLHPHPPRSLRGHRLKAAAGQLVLMAVLLTACAVYTNHHVNRLQRADFTQLEYFEDSKAG